MRSSDKTIALYPGTFDPITNGHLDILERASRLFDDVIIAVVARPRKHAALFSLSERLDLIRTALAKKKFGCPVHIEPFDGLLVNFAKKKKARVLVRGLRAISDFEYEFQMALMNRHFSKNIETVFLMPGEKYVYLSSSLVKTIAELDGNLSAFLPSSVVKSVKSKFRI